MRAALALAAEKDWTAIALRDIAAAADVSLAELHEAYRSKTAILWAYFRAVDESVLAATPAWDAGDAPRDRLFDVLMRRFDALSRDRAAVLRIIAALRCDPAAALCLSSGLPGSMRWMLEAADISAAGPCGRLKAKGLAAVWLAALRVWRRDDSPDMARTMAALDRSLRRAERLVRLLPATGRARRDAAPPEAADGNNGTGGTGAADPAPA